MTKKRELNAPYKLALEQKGITIKQVNRKVQAMLRGEQLPHLTPNEAKQLIEAVTAWHGERVAKAEKLVQAERAKMESDLKILSEALKAHPETPTRQKAGRKPLEKPDNPKRQVRNMQIVFGGATPPEPEHFTNETKGRNRMIELRKLCLKAWHTPELREDWMKHEFRFVNENGAVIRRVNMVESNPKTAKVPL